jgi:dethiobiotin synthetase
MKNVIAIVGIHTDIGKTIASAVIAEALQADYWKPVQAGNIGHRDKWVVENLISNSKDRVHAEAVLLSEPMSPHAAAAIDNVEIDHTKFIWPSTDKLLLIETAGGVLSPMYEDVTMADFVKYYELPVILVSKNYLGSINHTLLSVEVLRSRDIPILGIVMNGETNKESESFIEAYSKVPVIARIPFFEELTHTAIKDCAVEISKSLSEHVKH